MKKLIWLFMIVCVLAGTAHGALDVRKIRRNTMEPTQTLVQTVRRLVQDMNMELLKSGGFVPGRGTGDVYWVDSATGDDARRGTTVVNAVATWDAGNNLTTANNGDIVVMMENHEETLDNGTVGAVDLDTAGVTHVSLGFGSDMAEITYDTTTDDVRVDADNVMIMNIRFLAGVSAVTTAIDVVDGADDCGVVGCEFPEPTTSSWEFIRAVINTTADRFTFSHNRYRNMDATGATNVLDLDGGVINGLFIVGNDIMGEFSEGAIHSDDADLEVMLKDNIVHNATTGIPAVQFTAAAEGFAIDNRMSGDTLGTIFDPGSLRCFGNLESAAIDVGAREVPLIRGHTYVMTATTDATAGTDAMFNVTGGAILITALFGECTTAASGSPGTMVIEMNATAGNNYDSDFSTTVTVDTLGEGDIVKFSNATDEGVLSLLVNTAAGQTLSWFAPAGVIEQTLSSTGTFAITWYITFIVLDDGVTVVAS